jgi:hypothetical protein
MKDVLDRLPISQKVRVEKFWDEVGFKKKNPVFLKTGNILGL